MDRRHLARPFRLQLPGADRRSAYESPDGLTSLLLPRGMVDLLFEHRKVTQPGRKTPVSTHRTQGAAERAAKADLKKAGGGEVRIHNPKGQIRDSDTVPPGPRPELTARPEALMALVNRPARAT